MLSSAEVASLRLSLEVLLLGLEPWQLGTYLTQSSTTYNLATPRRLHKLEEFLNSPSSTFTVTRSSKPSQPDTSTQSSHTLDEKLSPNESNSSPHRLESKS